MVRALQTTKRIASEHIITKQQQLREM